MIHIQLTVAEAPAPDAAHTRKIRQAFLILLIMALIGMLQWLFSMAPSLLGQVMTAEQQLDVMRVWMQGSNVLLYVSLTVQFIGSLCVAWLVSAPRVNETRETVIRLCLALRILAAVQAGVGLLGWVLRIFGMELPAFALWVTAPMMMLYWLVLALVIGQRLKDLGLRSLQIEYYILVAAIFISGQVSGMVVSSVISAMQRSGNPALTSNSALQSMLVVMIAISVAMHVWKVMFYTRAYRVTRRLAEPAETASVMTAS